MKTIKQKIYVDLDLMGCKKQNLRIMQNADFIEIEPESIPEILKFIKESYDL